MEKQRLSRIQERVEAMVRSVARLAICHIACLCSRCQPPPTKPTAAPPRAGSAAGHGSATAGGPGEGARGEPARLPRSFPRRELSCSLRGDSCAQERRAAEEAQKASRPKAKKGGGKKGKKGKK